MEQTIEPIFHLDFSMLSRAFNIFNRHMIHHYHQHLLTDNLDYWVDSFPHFSEKISRRLAEKGNLYSLHYVLYNI